MHGILVTLSDTREGSVTYTLFVDNFAVLADYLIILCYFLSLGDASIYYFGYYNRSSKTFISCLKDFFDDS